MNNRDLNDFKEYAKSMYQKGEKDYMEGYINAMIDYKIINTSQAEEIIKLNKKRRFKK